MEQVMTANERFKFNNLCTKIKTKYPNLYEELGGKNIRKILRSTLYQFDATSTSNVFTTTDEQYIPKHL